MEAGWRGDRTRRYWFPKAYADLVARMRVPAGFILVVALAWFSNPSERSMAWGLPVCVLGIGLRAWAAGHLAKNERLATTGPYAYTRNPLYLGTLLVAAGLVLASRSWGLGVLCALMFIFVYLPVIELEEQHLREIFSAYGDYAARVPALLPRWTVSGKPEGFRFALYIRNQEYQAPAGLVAGILLLVWKVNR